MKEKRDNEVEYIEGRLFKNECIERQFNFLYDFWFNIVKSRIEYWVVNIFGLYQLVIKFVLNFFRCKLDVIVGIIIFVENICMILESDFVNKVYFIWEYFIVLFLLNFVGYGYIKKLLNMV